MNNKHKLFGIIAMVVVISFSMVSCDTGGDDGKTMPTTAGLYRETETAYINTGVAANDIDAAVAYVVDAGNPDGAYTLLLSQNVTNTAQLILNRANRHLTIIGLGGEITIQKNSTSNQGLFNVGGAGLTLGNNITLRGIELGGNSALVVLNGGNLTMLAGSKLTGHRISVTDSLAGPAVTVSNASSSFTMHGGEISGNHNNSFETTLPSGGVRVASGGIIIMTGGSITGNTIGTDTPMDVSIATGPSRDNSSKTGGTVGTSNPEGFATGWPQ